jgi:hypothetical protein
MGNKPAKETITVNNSTRSSKSSRPMTELTEFNSGEEDIWEEFV